MSIITKTGDRGETGLMYNRRVSKCHPRVEAYGCVDELNAALGLVRASNSSALVQRSVFAIQQDLVIVMGELATSVEDLVRYVKDGYQLVSSQLTKRLESAAHEVESRGLQFTGWATPGATPSAAALDAARTVCRRAERRVCALQEAGQLQNEEIIIYLNRLADVLWLMARWDESRRPISNPALPPEGNEEKMKVGRRDQD